MPPAHVALAASAQGAPGSMLDHYRRALAPRRAHPALRTGAQSPMMVDGDVVRLLRTGGGEQVFVAANLGGGEVRVAVPEGDWAHLGEGLTVTFAEGADEVTPGRWEAYLLRRKA